VLAAIYTRPQNLLFDEHYYYDLAGSILAGSYPDGYIIRPPLYVIFLAGVFRVFGAGFLPALLVSSLLRGGLVFGIAAMGRRYVSALAGLAGAFLIAVYPMLIFTYTRFVSETIYIPLFVVSFWYLEKAIRSDRPRHFVAAGAVAGLAALARSTSLFFTIVVAAWIAVRKSSAGRPARRNLASAALLVASMLIIVSPWTVRNAVVHKALILVDNSSAYNLWLITSGKQVREATEEWQSWGGQAERQSQGYARWFDHLRKDPAFHLRRMGVVIPKLFAPGGQPDVYSLSTVTQDRIPRESRSLKAVLTIMAPAVFWIITAGGLVGLALFEPNRPRRNLVIVTVVYFILLHAATLARPRFLLPMNALLAVYAGGLIAAALSRLGLTRRSHL
jgi:4-amino-4-deoxy-L-arabinose transferase-like glycosyltransferase